MYEREVKSWSGWLLHIYTLFGFPNPIFSIREIVILYMRESEIPYLRLRSYHELWSRSWHGWFLEHGFLVWNFIYNDIFGDVLLRGWNSQRKLSRFLPNTITFVPNDFSQCIHCVLSIMRCAFGSWPRGATNPVQTVRRFLPSFQGR